MLKYRYQQGRQTNKFVLPCLSRGILWQGLLDKEAGKPISGTIKRICSGYVYWYNTNVYRIYEC